MNHYPRCFGCGTANANGLHVVAGWDGTQGRYELLAPVDAEGAPGLVHGGYLAAVVDEVAALVATESAAEPAMTYRLEMKYCAPVAVGEPVMVTATVTGRGRRRLMVSVVGIGREDQRQRFTATVTFLTVARRVWLTVMRRTGRGPEHVDWTGDSSTYLRWQFDGGLAGLFAPDRLTRSLRVAVDVTDVRDGRWYLTAGPGGLLASQDEPGGCDAYASVLFHDWQRLLRGTASVEELMASAELRIDGQPAALADLLNALDVGRHD